MRIVIGYPPLASKKGTALLSQNRQFQWFNSPTYIYPVIPASAATLLHQKGHQVVWLDGIAENWTYDQWLKKLKAAKPDLLFIETKTPVIKAHWQIIKDLKRKGATLPNLKIVLAGDHVTALPKESLKKCPVDYIITGGHYDTALLDLVTQCKGSEPLHRKIWHGSPPDLNQLPFIDRKLTKWKLYAYKNGNFKYFPGTYTMAGRDCWWRREGGCTFCVPGNTLIKTSTGLIPIKNIVDGRKPIKVLTHTGQYHQVTGWHKRKNKQPLFNLQTLYLPRPLSLTGNHMTYGLKRTHLKRCTKRSAWSYICKPNRISKFLDCHPCVKKYYQQYQPTTIPADQIKKGDFLCIPIHRNTKKIKAINVNHVLKDQSLRSPLKINQDGVKFKWGLHRIPSTIPLTKDFLYLIGLYLAEGHVTFLKNRPNSAYIGWTFSKKEVEYIHQAKTIFKKTFKTPLSQTLNKQNNTIQLYLGATILAKLFKTLFSDNCYQKQVPLSFLELPLNQQRFLLKGVFHGDGHLRQRDAKLGGNEYILETTSKTLAEQVFSILLRFDVIPSYKIIKPQGKNLATQHKITLFSQDITQIFPEIKLKIKNTTHKKGFVLNNHAYLPVLKVSKQPHQDHVYNLTVAKDHSYTANFLAVKNCSWTTLYPQFSVRTPENLLDEIGELIKLGVKEVFDDTGTFMVGNWLKKFCKGMIKRGYHKKIVIGCNMRYGVLTKKDYTLMAKANFRLLLFGLESANQKTIDKLNKGITISKIKPELKIIKQVNKKYKSQLEPHATCMIGYPWESYQSAQKTIDFTKDLFKQNLIDSLQATIIIPYPGTKLFKQAQKNNWLKTKDWNRYDMSQSILKSPLTNPQIKKLTRSIYTSAITPKFILKKLLSIRNLNDLKWFYNASVKVIAHLLDFS